MREVYVLGNVTDEAAQEGTSVVNLLTQPRSTDDERRTWLTKYLQGVQEHTISATKEQLRAAELQMKSLGMLVEKKVQDDVRKLKDSMEALLDSFADSPRLRANTTVQEKDRGQKEVKNGD